MYLYRTSTLTSLAAKASQINTGIPLWITPNWLMNAINLMLNCFQVAVTRKIEPSGQRKKKKGGRCMYRDVALFWKLRHVHLALSHFTLWLIWSLLGVNFFHRSSRNLIITGVCKCCMFVVYRVNNLYNIFCSLLRKIVEDHLKPRTAVLRVVIQIQLRTTMRKEISISHPLCLPLKPSHYVL